MYSQLERRLADRVREFLKEQYQVEMPNIVWSDPPANVALGEFALPGPFELAKKLRKPPRKIAEEIVAGIGAVEGFEKFEVAGAGYINARVDRAAFASGLLLTVEVVSRGGEKFSSSTPASIPIRPRISGICGTPSLATHLSASCAHRPPGRRAELHRQHRRAGRGRRRRLDPPGEDVQGGYRATD